MVSFEIATKNKYRFPYKGLISVEDLWDLDVNALDQIYKTLNKQRKEMGEESLLKTKSAEEFTLENKIEIVKYIVTTKEVEKANRIAEFEKKEKKKKIMSIIAEKQDAALANMDIADLQKMLDELD